MERINLIVSLPYLVLNTNFVPFNYPKAMVIYHHLFRSSSRTLLHIGMSEWKDDLRKFMLHAGLRNTPTVFLFSDTQVISIESRCDHSSLRFLDQKRVVSRRFEQYSEQWWCTEHLSIRRTGTDLCGDETCRLRSRFTSDEDESLFRVHETCPTESSLGGLHEVRLEKIPGRSLSPVHFSPIGEVFRARLRQFPALVK